jgi:hypothetical protein
MSEPHWPSIPQVCEVEPLQRCVLGAHTPPHCPVSGSQTYGHVVIVYMPAAPQCFVTWPDAQVLVSGVHSPAHIPVAALQTNWQAVA